jgi:hypothetical protein
MVCNDCNFKSKFKNFNDLLFMNALLKSRFNQFLYRLKENHF